MCVNCGNTSCNECNSVISKRGLPGPQGPRGFTGPQGPQGVSGTILPENVVNAIEGANDPSSRNPFATTSDLGGYIPIPGTDVGNPVTGDIEVDGETDGIGFVQNFTSDNIINKISFKIDQGLYMYSEDTNLGAKGTIISFAGGARLRYEDDNGFMQLSSTQGAGIVIDSNRVGFLGLTGADYFGANYDDTTYVQKKYVDTAVVPLKYGDILLAGGIENTQVYTTGAGTGIASVDLSPIMVIGKDVTVSDLGNNASTHNIQIDSGVGNTILYNGATSQDITLNTNGASVTIRKITATKFMVI